MLATGKQEIMRERQGTMNGHSKNPGPAAQEPLRYRSVEELDPDGGLSSVQSGEFSPWASLPMNVPASDISRRRFLSLISASAALAFGTSCSKIDRGKIVPYTKRPGEIIPGEAAYYASTFQEGLITHGVLVRTREGRPIHIEGNTECPLFRGKTSMRAVGDILGLYDPDRLRRPSAGGRPSTWEQAGPEFARVMKEARDAGKPVLLLTDAIMSPTRKALIDALQKAVPTLRHAAWEPAASQPEILAAMAYYGEATLPQLHVDRADVILSLQADFLGGDGNAPPLIRDFAARRKMSKPSDPINRLWVIEGCMSLTGANADQRLMVRPSRIASLAFALARYLNESLGIALPSGISRETLQFFDIASLTQTLGVPASLFQGLCDDLRRAGKAALVVAGSALPMEAHIACNLLNTMLGAEGHTTDRSFSVPGPELLTYAGLQGLLSDAAQGAFAAAIFWGANPAYAFPDATIWKNAIAKIPQTVRIGLYEDETARDCHWRLPEHHWLEAWGDFEPSADLLTLRQPVIGAIYDTKQGEEILLSCLRALGVENAPSYLDYLKNRWQREVYPPDTPVDFESFWNAALHDGVLKRTANLRPAPVPHPEAIVAAVRSAAEGAAVGEMELVFLQGAAVYDGRYANNGWFNELPDPVTKTTWGNPLLLSVSDSARLGLKDQDMVRVTGGPRSLEVPVIIQPGQAPGVASLSLGYGRQTGNVAANIGVNAYSLMDALSAAPHLRGNVHIVRTTGSCAIPRTQTHHHLDGRDNARSWTLAEYSQKAGEEKEGLISLIPNPQFPGHKWGMAIDMSACVGCSACVIACQSENNIPVVGPERVAEGREMHWIRIDRYYEGNPQAPAIIHQPVLCQHCDNAPCEIVCPVNATTHSTDGLNQMAYNRCVGTRYCSNNCPYKVRRFNFFDYTSFKKAPENLVYNPEVTVRPRGVMEKCTFCIQRIQDARQRAKVEERPLADGEITPACAAACPAEAIVFGDLNDPNSRVSKMQRINRSYRMLEELGIKPAVTYLADISNPVGGKGKA
jgi:Fe-S-cluster-containing dehydrogenase component/anaerobic selenocysteine-containing dehydrogenase